MCGVRPLSTLGFHCWMNWSVRSPGSGTMRWRQSSAWPHYAGRSSTKACEPVFANASRARGHRCSMWTTEPLVMLQRCPAIAPSASLQRPGSEMRCDERGALSSQQTQSLIGMLRQQLLAEEAPRDRLAHPTHIRSGLIMSLTWSNKDEQRTRKGGE